mgnify:FL=1
MHELGFHLRNWSPHKHSKEKHQQETTDNDISQFAFDRHTIVSSFRLNILNSNRIQSTPTVVKDCHSEYLLFNSQSPRLGPP